jgi:hypothetical protein
MIYILTSAAFFLGCGFHVMGKVSALKKAFPSLLPNTIWGTFWKEEWNVLIGSVLVWVSVELSVFIINYNRIPIPDWLQWGIYPISLVLGYAGQRLIYKYLGTAESILEQKADQLTKDANG